MAKTSKSIGFWKKIIRVRFRTFDAVTEGCNIRPRQRLPSVEQGAEEQGMSDKSVQRDLERFKLLFTNSRPKMPEGYKAPLCIISTREQIAERLRKSKAA
jgi:DNA-binding transcriptional MocR family regulator